MWPYVSLNGQEFKPRSICFYITPLVCRSWAQLLLASQEIAPEIGPVVWVAHKPRRRYESKCERQRKASPLHYIHHRHISLIYKNLLSACNRWLWKVSESCRIKSAEEESKMEAGVRFPWLPVNLQHKSRLSVFLSCLQCTLLFSVPLPLL